MVMANRGLAGIDGVVSTAIGIALARRPTRSLAYVGDLTFLHDAPGLVLGPDEARPDLTVVVDSPVTAAPAGADAEAVRRAFLAQAEAAPDRYVVVPGELLDTHSPDGLVSPVVRRRLATLLATRYPAAGEGDPAPQMPATPGATSTAAAERTGRSVG